MPSRSSKVFSKLDGDGNKALESEEMSEFIASQDQLWAKLSTRLKQPKEKAIQAATLVAMELATGLPGEMALGFSLTKEQFKRFHKDYVLDPDGAEEFFQRAVFANFDEDNSGELDENELDTFLDAIYETRDVRKGRVSLYGKDQMKALILQKHDADGGGTLDFNEIRSIMGGGAVALGKLKDIHEESGEELVVPVSSPRQKSSSSSLTKPNSRHFYHQQQAEEDDFCAWLERTLTGSSSGGFCKGKKCIVS